MKNLLDSSNGCYEYFDSYKVGMGSIVEHRYKHLLRIVPIKRCTDRMIKKNYYRGNKSIGTIMDFELAFQGYDNYMTKRVNEIKAENKHIFDK